MAMPQWSNGIREILTRLGLKMLTDWFNDFNTYMTGLFNTDNSYTPPRLTDASAPNNAVYYSTTTNKLTYKDSNGTVHALW